MNTPGPWRAGKAGDQIVADVPIENGPGGSDSVDYYGGYLVAESVAPCNQPLIAAAPDLLASCKELREALAASMRVLDAANLQDAFLEAMHAAGVVNGIGVRADAAIAKAKGR